MLLLCSWPLCDKDVVCVLQRGRTKVHADRIGVDVVSQLCRMLQTYCRRLFALLERLIDELPYLTRHEMETAVGIKSSEFTQNYSITDTSPTARSTSRVLSHERASGATILRHGNRR